MGARLVLVDGSPNGRPEGFVRELTTCDDGRRAIVVTNAWGRRHRVWSYALDDGAPTLVCEARRDDVVKLARRGGRVFTHRPGERAATWRDLETGETGKVALRGDQRLEVVSPDGRAVCLVGRYMKGGAKAQIVRVDEGRVVASLACIEDPVFDDEGTAFVSTPAGEVVAVSSIDGATRSIVARSVEGARRGRVRAERGGGRLLLSVSARAIEVIEVATGEVVKRLRFSRDVTVDDFAAGRVLLRERGVLGMVHTLIGVGGGRVVLPASLGAVALTPDGATVVAYCDPMLRAIDAAAVRVRPWHDGHDAKVTALVWSRDGSLLASRAEDGVVRVRDVRAGALLWSLEHERGREGALAFSPDGRTLYALGAHALVAWELATGTEVQRHPDVGHRASAMCVSPDGRYLATLGIGMPPRLYDLADSVRCVTKLEVSIAATEITFNGDGLMRALVNERNQGASASWFSARGERVRAAPITYAAAEYAAIEGDVTSVLARRTKVIARVDLRNGSAVECCAIDGEDRIVCATEGVVVCEALRTVNEEFEGSALIAYDLATGGEIARIALEIPLKRATLSPDGAKLAVLFENGRVEVFALGGDGHA